MENEYRLNGRLYTDFQSDEIDYRMERLLIDRFRLKFEDYCLQIGCKNENIRGSIKSKPRNMREAFDKLTFFQKVYHEQLSFLDQVFLEWPSHCEQKRGVREIEKREFLKTQTGIMPKEDELLCIFEEYYGHKYRNYEALISGSVRINILDSREGSRQVTLENTRSSKKRIKYNYEIYI